jgi:pimeloyl-ACP methyl ester carboxylesterase
MISGHEERQPHMNTVDIDGVAIGIESFGDDGAPLVLLVGGTTMLSWPDALCGHLAAGGRRVVRYDLRDSGQSARADPEASAYTLRDLAADAAALVGALGGGPAHLAGIGVGGMVAQIAVLDHPGAFSALTLAGTRPVAPGPPDDDSPTTIRRRWAGWSSARRRTGPTGPRWRSSQPLARGSSATTPSPREQSPRASGTAHRAANRRHTWPTSWAWCFPGSTAHRAGASGCPGSRFPPSWSTAGRVAAAMLALG